MIYLKGRIERAIESALIRPGGVCIPDIADAVIAVLREQEQEQEPVATVRPGLEGWKGAAIAWEVCASIHEKWAKGKDALYTTRHSDFLRHAANARQMLSAPMPPSVPASIVAALQWYADEACALAVNAAAHKDTAMLASVQVLILDAGTRARMALAAAPKPEDAT